LLSVPFIMIGTDDGFANKFFLCVFHKEEIHNLFDTELSYHKQTGITMSFLFGSFLWKFSL